MFRHQRNCYHEAVKVQWWLPASDGGELLIDCLLSSLSVVCTGSSLAQLSFDVSTVYLDTLMSSHRQTNNQQHWAITKCHKALMWRKSIWWQVPFTTGQTQKLNNWGSLQLNCRITTRGMDKSSQLNLSFSETWLPSHESLMLTQPQQLN